MWYYLFDYRTKFLLFVARCMNYCSCDLMHVHVHHINSFCTDYGIVNISLNRVQWTLLYYTRIIPHEHGAGIVFRYNEPFRADETRTINRGFIPISYVSAFCTFGCMQSSTEWQRVRTICTCTLLILACWVCALSLCGQAHISIGNRSCTIQLQG